MDMENINARKKWVSGPRDKNTRCGTVWRLMGDKSKFYPPNGSFSKRWAIHMP